MSLEEQKKLKEYVEPEELTKLGKYPHRSFREIRAGRARETGEIFRQSAEAKAEAEENAAVLEILEKNGAFDEVADKIAGEGEAIRDKIAGEGEAVRDKRAGGA